MTAADETEPAEPAEEDEQQATERTETAEENQQADPEAGLAAEAAGEDSPGGEGVTPSRGDDEPQPVAASAETPDAGKAPAEEPHETEPYRESWVFDNPSIGRALRYTFAEKRLARAVFVNALLLVVMLALIQEAFGRYQLGLFHETISFGRLAYLGVAFVEAVVVSLLTPIGFMQVFEAERREECFDQVVTTGVSPHRIIFGRYVATLAFVAVVLGSSLPFFATTVVLNGASVGDVVHVYAVLALYVCALGALTSAVAVGLDDTALPAVIAALAVTVLIACTFSRRGPAVFAAWSPIRHVILEFSDIAQGLRLGHFRPPRPYGLEVACSTLSVAYYGVLTFLGLAYTYVGPDLELTAGLDSFDSVSTSRKAEATQARRGVARTLLRTVQLRFFYENLTPRAQALSPLLRATATLVIFAGAHVAFLGAFWPASAPKGYANIASSTVYPYLWFCSGTLVLLALSGGGARSSLMARMPVALGPLKLGRFPTLFLLFAVALAIPPALWSYAADASGYGRELLTPDTLRQLYGLVAGYAAFVFAVSMLMAMLTTNPYSATGFTLIFLFAANLTPAVWIPLYTGNVVDEGSAFMLDLSPLSAAYSIARPAETIPLTRFGATGEPVRFAYKPDWVPFVRFVATVGTLCLISGIVLAVRERLGLTRPPGESAT